MQLSLKKQTQLVLPLLVVLLLSSCGNRPKIVQNLKVSTSVVDEDAYANVDADLFIGNITFPAITLPIIIPKGALQIGTLSINPMAQGKNHLAIAINLTEATQLNMVRVVLPNGGQVPLIGTERGIAIPIGNGGHVKIYLALGEGQLVLGVAIPFKTLDSMGRRIGTTSFFPVFNIQGVFGAAGLFTSKTSGQNGFGLFVDLSSLLPNVESKLRLGKMNRIDYREITPSSSKKSKINKEVYKLHKRRKRLKLH